MGTTFVNLQIRELSVLETDKFSSDCIIKNLSEGWTTIISEKFDIGSLGKVARTISKKIDKAILSVEYYDDVMLMMNVYRKGKVITSHVTENSYGYLKKTGNPITFLEELEFSIDEAAYLNEIFKCEDLSKKMQLLEKFFGVALWIDHRMLIEAGDNSFRYQRDLHFVQEYMNEMKRSNLIKNQTKVKMLMEFEGAIIQSLGHSKYLIGTPPYNHHNDTYQEEYLYTHRPDGRIEPLFEAKWMKYEKYEIGQIYAVENFTALFNTHFSLLDDQGLLLVKEPLSSDGYPMMLLQDGSFIYSNHGPHRIITLYGTDCTKKWELEVGYLHTYPQLYNNFFYLHYEDQEKGKAEIIKLSLSGEVLSRFELIPCGGGHWGEFLFDQAGKMYYCCNIYENGRAITKLFCLTEDLEQLSVLEIDYTSFEGLIDIKNNKIFLLLFEKELIVIDLNTNEVYSRKKYDEMAALLYVDLFGRVVILRGRSLIEILDSQLNYISRHRLKGSINGLYKNDAGNNFFLTGSGGAHQEGGAKKMILRVYEIT